MNRLLLKFFQLLFAISLLFTVQPKLVGQSAYRHCYDCDVFGAHYNVIQEGNQFTVQFSFEGPAIEAGIWAKLPDGSSAFFSGDDVYTDPNFYNLDETLNYKFDPTNAFCELEVGPISFNEEDPWFPFEQSDFSCSEVAEIPYDIHCIGVNSFRVGLDLQSFKTGLAEYPDDIEILLPNNQRVNVGDADYYLDETIYFLQNLGDIRYAVSNQACNASTGCIEATPEDFIECADEFSPECFAYFQGASIEPVGTLIGPTSILQHGLLSPNTYWPPGYISIIPFGSEVPVAQTLTSLLQDEELGIYEQGYGQFYQYWLIDICLNDAGEYLLHLGAGYDDLIAPYTSRVVVRLDGEGQILESQAYIEEGYYAEPAIDFPCGNPTVDVSSTELDGEGNALYQKDNFIIETNFPESENALNYRRYHTDNPSEEIIDIGISNIEVDSYTYSFVESADPYPGYELDCRAIFEGIHVEVSNYGNTDICYFELTLQRTSFSQKYLEVFDCVAPGESIVLDFPEAWAVTGQWGCNDSFKAYLLNPNHCWDVDANNNTVFVEGELDENYCPFESGYVGDECQDDNGNNSFINEECQCLFNTGIKEIESSFEIGPNPTTDFLHIKSNEDFQLRLYGVDGTLLVQQHANIKVTIDFGAYPGGTYFIHLQTEAGSLFKKIVRN